MEVLVIGIAGGTGSGKSTVARKLAAAMPEGTCQCLEYDSYYKDLGHLSQQARAHINFDHPDALETDLLAAHVRALRSGEPIEVPMYDFVTHTRSADTRAVPPSPVVLVEGIMALAIEKVRRLFDVKIFVDTDADIRMFRRIRRDLENRGRDFASVREQYYRHVRPMHIEYVEPSKRWADLIIPEGGDNHVALEVVVARLRQVIGS